jgi:hypothetical protein
MDLTQMAPVDVRVYLGRRNVDMPQHLLHGREIRTPLQKVRGEAVPQGVGRHPLV